LGRLYVSVIAFDNKILNPWDEVSSLQLSQVSSRVTTGVFHYINHENWLAICMCCTFCYICSLWH